MEGDRAGGGTFAEALAALKRRGATVLVQAGADADDPVCDSLLGDDAAGRRRLLLDDGSRRHRDHAGPEEHLVRVPVPAVGQRSAAAVAGGGAAPLAASEPTPGDLARLVTDVRRGIETLGGDHLEPGELRLCGGDLTPLVASFGPVAVRRYLHLVGRRVVDVGGLGHFHLPPRASASASLVPLFDVVVEVRRRPDGEREQRWRLRDSGLQTGWLPLVVD